MSVEPFENLSVQRLGYELTKRDSIVGEGKRCFSSQRSPDRLWGTTTVAFSGMEVTAM
jgi:hypothetical protein